MPEEVTEVEEEIEIEEENTDEFDGAFAERAEQSENAETAEANPGEVGLDDADDEDKDFDESFDSAANDPGDQAVQEEEEEDNEFSTKLAENEAEIERLKQKERSQRGRVSALNKKLAEQKAASEPPEVEEEITATTTDADDTGDWDEFAEEFPEMAAIVDKRLSSVSAQVDKVSNKVEQVSTTQDALVDDQLETYKETQFDALLERHSDVEEIKGSAEFAKWRQDAPDDIQAKIKGNHSADDAADVLDAFKEQTKWGQTEDAPGKSEVELINERRAKNLKQSQGISSKKMGRAPKQDTGSDDDFDAGFASNVSRKEKQRSVRR